MSKHLSREQIERAILQTAPPVARARLFEQRVVLFGLVAHLPDAMIEAEIDTPLRVAHFIAQLAHESDGFSTVEEYASGRAYEGRKDLGNTEKGDGVRFKGRGPIQCTGRDNYRHYGEKMGVDLIREPELLLKPYYGSRMAVLFWLRHDLNKYADRNDIRMITKRINGGHNGLEDRIKYFGFSSQAVGLPAGFKGPLKRGVAGVAVKSVQARLKDRGYRVGVLDGDFGPQTEQALRHFQRDHGFAASGKIYVDGKVWQTLFL